MRHPIILLAALMGLPFVEKALLLKLGALTDWKVPLLAVVVMVLTAGTRQIVVMVLASPDGRERTRIVYDVIAGTLSIDPAHSAFRGDVKYQFHPLDPGGVFPKRASGEPHRCPVTTAPLALAPGEPLQMRILLDGPILEVFANSRQSLTQQVFPNLAESRAVAVASLGGRSRLLHGRGYHMAPASFTNEKHPRP